MSTPSEQAWTLLDRVRDRGPSGGTMTSFPFDTLHDHVRALISRAEKAEAQVRAWQRSELERAYSVCVCGHSRHRHVGCAEHEECCDENAQGGNCMCLGFVDAERARLRTELADAHERIAALDQKCTLLGASLTKADARQDDYERRLVAEQNRVVFVEMERADARAKLEIAVEEGRRYREALKRIEDASRASEYPAGDYAALMAHIAREALGEEPKP